MVTIVDVFRARFVQQLTLASMFSLFIVFGGCSNSPVAHPSSPTTGFTGQSTVAPVLSTQMTPSVDSMRVGETLTFSLKLELGEGVPPSGPMPFWSSTNRAAVLIDATSGKATAVGEGSATIEVTGRGGRASRTIRVTSS
jgi:uncharacterized protein YjdB